jgi:hypothetical protein
VLNDKNSILEDRLASVPDPDPNPDPRVFWPPGSGSTS